MAPPPPHYPHPNTVPNINSPTMTDTPNTPATTAHNATIHNPCRPQCNLPPGTTIAEAITLATTAGATPTLAAHWAGTTPNTLHTWLTKGTNALNQQHTTGKPNQNPTLTPYIELTQNLQGANADAQMRHLANWQTHFESDWRAVAEFMARRWPDEWGRDRDRSVDAGSGGVGVGAVVLSLDEAEALVAAVEARVALGVVEARGVEVVVSEEDVDGL